MTSEKKRKLAPENLSPPTPAENVSESGISLPMKAKRSQAISRHSLAERIRRERISVRMKFLQGLVPGCDKITGKAVMLDEIINYILSLQHQVEFLSMKIAAVDTGEKCQHDQFLSTDVCHLQGAVNDHEVSSFHSLPDNYAPATNSSNDRIWHGMTNCK